VEGNVTDETDIERQLLMGICSYLADIFEGKQGAAEVALIDNEKYARIAAEHMPESAFREMMLKLIPQAVGLVSGRNGLNERLRAAEELNRRFLDVHGHPDNRW
jgi:hypothetical protein